MSLVVNEKNVAAPLLSPSYVEVRRRVFRQLVESILFEEILPYEEWQQGELLYFRLTGYDGNKRPVTYECRGKRRFTFGRISIEADSLVRMDQEGHKEADSIVQFIYEVLSPQGISPLKLQFFIQEIEYTLLNDTVAQEKKRRDQRKLLDQSYDDLEGDLMDAHPYHPSYKSRIGFTLQDHYQYGPEFKKEIRPIWLAVHQKYTKSSVREGQSYLSLIKSELGLSQFDRFQQVLHKEGCLAEDYLFIPVHPWQWLNQIIPHSIQEISEKTIVFLGESEDVYQAQQSIRTLANRSNPSKAYLKTSLHIMNTSTKRYLKPYSVISAPYVSSWLAQIVEEDSFLKEEVNVIILQEFAGATYEPPEREQGYSPMYGAIGCIWRESIQTYLKEEEQAVPFNALYSREIDGRPFIDEWIKQIGLHSWLKRLIQKCIIPIVHLAVKHGIALESHAQNMILVHQDGIPQRVALKDFHEGVEYTKDFLLEPERVPKWSDIHPTYQSEGLNQFFEMDSIDLIREMTIDALFFINVGELAILLADEYDFDEIAFWSFMRECIDEYLQAFPELKERFEALQLYKPICRLEQLTKRRLDNDHELLVHDAPNPLHFSQECNLPERPYTNWRKGTHVKN